MANVTARRALYYVHNIKRSEAEYAEECESYRRQGFIPHYCQHGKDMWTDYDNICGPCEDGYGTYELALMLARADVAEMRKRTDWLAAMPKGNMPHKLFRSLLDWATEPIVTGLPE